MTLDESAYVIARFDRLCEMMIKPLVGPPRMTVRLRDYLRNDLVGNLTTCVLDEELAERQDADRHAALDIPTPGVIEVNGCTYESEGTTVTLDSGLWIDADGCVIGKDGKLL